MRIVFFAEPPMSALDRIIRRALHRAQNRNRQRLVERMALYGAKKLQEDILVLYIAALYAHRLHQMA